MKDFMIIYKNVRDGKTLEGLTNAKDMLSALLEAETLCGNCIANGIQLEVCSITEVVATNNPVKL